MPATSPFLTPSANTKHQNLALISLGRDHIPTILTGPTPEDPHGKITNTRFGSYPHSTLVDIPWGSQVVASNVGSRERKRGKKRKREQQGVKGAQKTPQEEEDEASFEAASSGFAHVLPPTPESWTTSLPHRTQVVYTPDYSFILQKIGARPGSRVIEAGAGSGSFTHASARAVFNGYPSGASLGKECKSGRVFSFEYHRPRFEALQQEIKDHGLEDIVTITHRDVYDEGFCIDGDNAPHADAIFLDLPAPWLALPNLTRSPNKAGPSPLNSSSTVYICSFSPCIEQAQRSVSTLHDLGWVSVTMSALHHSRLDVRRDRIGLQEEGLRSVNATPANVEEALSRLRELEAKTADFAKRRRKEMDKLKQMGKGDEFPDDEPGVKGGPGSKQERLREIQEGLKDRKLYKEGRLVHRTEQELKTHTSYLVFAVLPRGWTEDDEAECAKLLEVAVPLEKVTEDSRML